MNYATEKARVAFPPSLTPADLIATVEQVGYAAPIPKPPAATGLEPAGDPEEEAVSRLRLRLWISVAVAVPVVALAMVPALQFTSWQWLSAILAAPVVVYGWWVFHKATWVNLRHGTATMDTLISVGTLAAFAWSKYALHGRVRSSATVAKPAPGDSGPPGPSPLPRDGVAVRAAVIG